MAQQEGIIKLKGKIGDLTFYKTKSGYQAREAKGVDPNRIANDPNFKRTRENGAEFGRACRAGKLFRTVFKPLSQQFQDSYMSTRLVKAMIKAIQADAINERGLRTILDAEAELLTGFEFNSNGSVSSTLSVPYSSAIDRALGNAQISLPAFSAKDMVAAPGGATHFKFTAAAAVINFETGAYEIDIKESALDAVNSMSIPAQNLGCSLSPASSGPIFLLLGISFYQRVNSYDYPLSNGSFNGLSVVLVAGT